MRWQFSARLTSLIVLAVVSLAVGGAALGLALARGDSTGSPKSVAGHVGEAGYHSKSKADSWSNGRADAKRDMDRYEHPKRTRVDEHYMRGKDGRDTFHHWWGSRRVIVVPWRDASPRSFFRDHAPFMRRVDRTQSERQVVRPGGMVIAVGEVTAVGSGVIQMLTVLGNEVTIDVSRLEAGAEPKVGSSAIVIAERDGDGYVAQSMDLLEIGLSEMLDGMRARSRSAS